MEGCGWEIKSAKKKSKRHMVFFLFIVSHSGVGFSKFLALGVFFYFSLSCRLLEGSGS